jgi:hypothetical protein
MLGYDMGWASFHVVEVMSSARIHLKSVGYLAAAQSFDQQTDVLMLTTNLLKKVSTSLDEAWIQALFILLGSELYARRYCCHFEWNIPHRYAGPSSGFII